jgi:hypothetical protein
MEVAKTPPSAKSDSDRNRHCLKRRATLWRACRPEPSLMASTGRGLRAKDTQICTAFSFRDTPMKTTLDLDDTLLARARALAARQRSSLTRLIEEGLQLRLRAQRIRAKPSKLPVYPGKGGLAPGLTGLSNKAMFDAADKDAEA